MNDQAKSEFQSTYGGKVRVRVCGVLVEDNSILLIRHSNIGSRKVLWSPPGGGLDFGETVEEALKREFLEETNLEITVDRFMLVNEVISDQIHAIELFFWVQKVSGILAKGTDPETNTQFIEEVKWLKMQEVNELPQNQKHNIFHKINSITELNDASGKYLYRF